MLTPREIEDELWSLLNKVRCIRPAHGRHPHHFHEDKAAAAEAILKLIDGVKGNRTPSHRAGNGKITAWRAPKIDTVNRTGGNPYTMFPKTSTRDPLRSC